MSFKLHQRNQARKAKSWPWATAVGSQQPRQVDFGSITVKTSMNHNVPSSTLSTSLESGKTAQLYGETPTPWQYKDQSGMWRPSLAPPPPQNLPPPRGHILPPPPPPPRNTVLPPMSRALQVTIIPPPPPPRNIVPSTATAFRGSNAPPPPPPPTSRAFTTPPPPPPPLPKPLSISKAFPGSTLAPPPPRPPPTLCTPPTSRPSLRSVQPPPLPTGPLPPKQTRAHHYAKEVFDILMRKGHIGDTGRAILELLKIECGSMPLPTIDTIDDWLFTKRHELGYRKRERSSNISALVDTTSQVLESVSSKRSCSKRPRKTLALVNNRVVAVRILSPTSEKKTLIASVEGASIKVTLDPSMHSEDIDDSSFQGSPGSDTCDNVPTQQVEPKCPTMEMHAVPNFGQRVTPPMVESHSVSSSPAEQNNHVPPVNDYAKELFDNLMREGHIRDTSNKIIELLKTKCGARPVPTVDTIDGWLLTKRQEMGSKTRRGLKRKVLVDTTSEAPGRSKRASLTGTSDQVVGLVLSPRRSKRASLTKKSRRNLKQRPKTKALVDKENQVVELVSPTWKKTLLGSGEEAATKDHSAKVLRPSTSNEDNYSSLGQENLETNTYTQASIQIIDLVSPTSEKTLASLDEASAKGHSNKVIHTSTSNKDNASSFDRESLETNACTQAPTQVVALVPPTSQKTLPSVDEASAKFHSTKTKENTVEEAEYIAGIEENFCHDVVWNTYFKALQRFQFRHGHTCATNRQLSNYVTTQQQKYHDGTIAEDRKDALNKVGFQWIDDSSVAVASQS